MSTPTPWGFDGLYVIAEDGITKGDGSHWIVAKIHPHNGDGATETDRANAELIVRAVNAHATSIEAMKRAVWFLTDEAEWFNDDLISDLSAAIQMAEGPAV